MCSMKILHTRTGSALGVTGFAHLPLGLRTTGLNTFLVFSPAPLARQGVTYCLVCTRALGMAALLV